MCRRGQTVHAEHIHKVERIRTPRKKIDEQFYARRAGYLRTND